MQSSCIISKSLVSKHNRGVKSWSNWNRNRRQLKTFLKCPFFWNNQYFIWSNLQKYFKSGIFRGEIWSKVDSAPFQYTSGNISGEILWIYKVIRNPCEYYFEELKCCESVAVFYSSSQIYIHDQQLNQGVFSLSKKTSSKQMCFSSFSLVPKAFKSLLPVWLVCSVPSFLPVSVEFEHRGCCPERTETASPARTHRHESAHKPAYAHTGKDARNTPAAAQQWTRSSPSWLASVGSPGQRAALPPEWVLSL